MNKKYTDEDLINSARKYTTIAEWRKAERTQYEMSLRRGLRLKIREFLKPEIGGCHNLFWRMIKSFKSFSRGSCNSYVIT